MGKNKKRKPAASKGQVDMGKQQTKTGIQGLNIWIWMLIGAGAGLIVWFLLRMLEPLLGG